MRARKKDIVIHFKPIGDSFSDIKLKQIVDQLEFKFIAGKLNFEGHILGDAHAIFYFRDTEDNVNNVVKNIVHDCGYHADCFSIETECKKHDLSGSPKSRRARIFDVWAVPLVDGTFGYFQIIDRIIDRGDIIRVFDVTTDQPVGVEVLLEAPLLFPPVSTLLIPKVIKRCNLHFISNWKCAVPPFFFRHAQFFFPCTENYDKPDWFIWSKANGSSFIGALSEDYRNIEPRWIWPLELIVKRIERRIPTHEIDEYSESGGFAK